MIKQLFETNCIKCGKFTLKNKTTSKYYFNIKNIISYPKLVKEIGDALYEKLDDFDIICGIPYGGLATAMYISTTYNKPLIIVRDKPKEYGTKLQIEGEYSNIDRCVIVDDVITSGKSLQETIDILKDRVNIVDAAVVFNRQQNFTTSIPVKYLLCKNDIVKYRLKEISEKKKSKICFAADINDPERLFEILDKIGKYIVIVKIHYDTFDLKDQENIMNQLIEKSIEQDFLIMEDRKFNDISSIVDQQYKIFSNWVDLITVHSLVAPDVVKKLSGVLLVANMSNNTYDFTDEAKILAEKNKDHVIGFITQHIIDCGDLVCMTPGVSLKASENEDQKYRSSADIDTDFFIIGRTLYESDDIETMAKIFM
tara:strand:+ start:484 stop:1587 length:1104 start_codon:yes stop_codon:yes gene_type:complete